MDNNIENTDRFFRDRLSVYEEMPDAQLWDKIVSKLEAKKRRKLVYMVLRIAAGMTLLASLGLSYHFVNKSVNQKSMAVIPKAEVSEEPGIAPSANLNTTTNSDRQYTTSPDKSGIQKNIPLSQNSQPAPIAFPTAVFDLNTSNGSRITAGIASLKRHEASLFFVPLPQRLGYHRLTKEEIQEQTDALTADISNDILSSDENKDSRWMLGSEVAPLYSYRKIESDYLDKSAVEDMNNSEQGLIALAGGLRVGFKAGRRLSVQSGLYYSRYGQEKNNGGAVSLDQIAYVDRANMTYLSIPNSTGTIQANDDKTSRYESVIATTNGNKMEFQDFNGYAVLDPGTTQITEGDVTAIQYFDYLELPVTVKYKIIDRKLGFSFLGRGDYKFSCE